MNILKDNTKLEFSSWEQIISEAKRKEIHSLKINNNQFIQSLEEIMSVSHSSFFSSPQFGYIISEINQVKYYDENRIGIQYSFVEDLSKLSELIKKSKFIQGSDKLIKLGIFTNFGVFSQFLMTIWLNDFLPVLDMEVNNPPINTDLLAEYNGDEIHFHIKDIREQEREWRLSDTITILEYKLSERAHKEGKEQRLAVKSFSAVPPIGLDMAYWERIADDIENIPQIKKITFLPDPTTKNTEEIIISVEFVWKDYSGVFDGPVTGFNNTLRLEQEYNKFNIKVLHANPSDKEKHILIALTDDTYNWADLRKQIASDLIGLLLVKEFDYDITRSPFLFPVSMKSLESKLNKVVPKYKDLFCRGRI